MKKTAIIICMAMSFFNCQSQNNKEKSATIEKDSIKPETSIHVKKEYDEHGNLISVDSTYSYFYSNIKNDSILENSIFKGFRSDFNKQFNAPIDSLFMNDFFHESPFMMHDFYTKDFFQNNFKSHQDRIDKIIKRMDSLKNSYYKKQKKVIKTI